MAKVKLQYKDEGKPDDTVALGAFSQVACKRLYGMEALKSDDPEPVLYACFVELVGPAQAKSAGPDGFDKWLQTISHFELVAADKADPPVATPTPSSVSSPGSPPTSV